MGSNEIKSCAPGDDPTVSAGRSVKDWKPLVSRVFVPPKTVGAGAGCVQSYRPVLSTVMICEWRNLAVLLGKVNWLVVIVMCVSLYPTPG
jgi:hypothetical protein